jgi:N6-adenosine-specific RNA methylase IME4
MSKTKRGASSNYSVMTDDEIMNLDIPGVCASECVLVFWVPSSKISFGVKCCENWGFTVSQTFVWVKTKQNPLINLGKDIYKILKKEKKEDLKKLISEKIVEFDVGDVLNFFMGHCFRQTHEIALIATKGKYTKLLKNRSQRSVDISPALPKHSQKPEELQNRLDIMFGDVKKLELFARRERNGWNTLGNDIDGLDIREALEKFKNE